MSEFLDTATVLSILGNRFNAELLIRGDDNKLYRIVGAEVTGSRVVLQMDEIPIPAAVAGSIALPDLFE